MFYHVFNSRIFNLVENISFPAKEQADFRKNFRTSDQSCIVKTLAGCKSALNPVQDPLFRLILLSVCLAACQYMRIIRFISKLFGFSHTDEV